MSARHCECTVHESTEEHARGEVYLPHFLAFFIYHVLRPGFLSSTTRPPVSIPSHMPVGDVFLVGDLQLKTNVPRLANLHLVTNQAQHQPHFLIHAIGSERAVRAAQCKTFVGVFSTWSGLTRRSRFLTRVVPRSRWRASRANASSSFDIAVLLVENLLNARVSSEFLTQTKRLV